MQRLNSLSARLRLLVLLWAIATVAATGLAVLLMWEVDEQRITLKEAKQIIQYILLVIVILIGLFSLRNFYQWIIIPLKNLQNGIDNVLSKHTQPHLNSGNSAEFIKINDEFNQLGDQLQNLYLNLEQKVAEKTAALEGEKNNLETLYAFSYFLNKIQTQKINDAAQLFLARILTFTGAVRGDIRMADEPTRRLDLIARAEHPFARASDDPARETIRRFDIRHGEQNIAEMTLEFACAEVELELNQSLIIALCNQFGIALSNINLLNENSRTAVLQERNLIAQGLHDSIAQVLNFLGLQTDMLEDALQRQDRAQTEENIRFIRAGIKECYDDVRELVVNFRVSLAGNDYKQTVSLLVNRFKRQTDIAVGLRYRGDGAPLSGEQQLQFMFILQECLSNIRKHAQATGVEIEFNNGADFIMRIRDNGKGFDGRTIIEENSVGLKIMQERAVKIHASLTVQSARGKTEISVILPQKERVIG